MSDNNALQLPLLKFTNEGLELVQIPLDDLPASSTFKVPKGHPTQEFVQNILENGQREPIRVSYSYRSGYFVVAGRRRIMAIRKLNEEFPDDERFKTVMAVVSEESDDAVVAASAASNNMRSENPLSDLEAIKYFQEKNPSIDDKALARILGIPLQTLKKRKALLKLDSLLMTEFEAGNIAIGAAEAAAKMPIAIQADLYTTLRKKGHLSAEDVTDAQRVRVQETADTQLELPLLDDDVETQEISTSSYVLTVDLPLLILEQDELIKANDLLRKKLKIEGESLLDGLENLISSIIGQLEETGSATLIVTK